MKIARMVRRMSPTPVFEKNQNCSKVQVNSFPRSRRYFWFTYVDWCRSWTMQELIDVFNGVCPLNTKYCGGMYLNTMISDSLKFGDGCDEKYIGYKCYAVNVLVDFGDVKDDGFFDPCDKRLKIHNVLPVVEPFRVGVCTGEDIDLLDSYSGKFWRRLLRGVFREQERFWTDGYIERFGERILDNNSNCNSNGIEVIVDGDYYS